MLKNKGKALFSYMCRFKSKFKSKKFDLVCPISLFSFYFSHLNFEFLLPKNLTRQTVIVFYL